MTITRRKFIVNSSIAGVSLGLFSSSDLFAFDSEMFSYESSFIKLQLNREKPKFDYFSTDSLGKSAFQTNPILNKPEPTIGNAYKTIMEKNTVAYFMGGNRKYQVWKVKCSEKTIRLQTNWQAGAAPEPFVIELAQKINHSTVLGNVAGKNLLKFPCVLHLPGMGTFEVHCSDRDTLLTYDASREKGEPFVKLSFAGATADKPAIVYTLISTAIYPESKKIETDDRFDGYRRNYINIFQLNPQIQCLANNSASDTCAFCLFLYAEMARKCPELVKGLTAMDLIRNSCDQYLNGMLGYGQVGYKVTGWTSKFDSCDSAPSLIMAACYYIMDTKDYEWGRKNYAGIKAWAIKMMATDHNGNGLIEYGYSGNSGSWREKQFKRPANWWDTIGFGYEDAYSNALAYRACNLLADVALKLDQKTDATNFARVSWKVKSNYYKNFYNPETGVLAGWKSEDGKLHDYYFTFVNSLAICYGLVDKEQAIGIMKSLLAKMKAVGYTDFKLGLPGNLIPVRDEDYAHADRRWGWGKDAEGKDGFQIYENGGASGCYVYFTLKALLDLGMKEEAEMILMPMLESYKIGDFEGYCPGSQMTKDWKTWNGECWGYEGFLVDNYLPFLAVNYL
ncbi:MAG: hypothetical protein V4553_05900 [Bacteroidota bacterium]